MGKKNTMDSYDNFATACSSIISGTISVFILLLVTVFPLIYHNSYFDILETKYQCYYLIVIGMMAVTLVLSLVMMFIDFKEYGGEHTKMLFTRLKPENWKTTFHVADVAVIAFLLFSAISTLQSDYFYESFWGNEGRYTGLFLTILYVAAYFLISRCWKLKGWLLELFLVSGIIMCVIGITDYFQMDVLHFRGKVNITNGASFISTVGNINTYTAYVALVMAFAATMFATTKSVLKGVWYYGCLIVTFFAIITGSSDNAYLSMGAMFAFLPFILFRSKKGLCRYLVMVASLFTVILYINGMNQKYADTVIGLGGLFEVIAGFGGLRYAIAALWGAALGVFIYSKKTASKDEIGKALVIVWGVIVAAVVLGVCFVLYDANIAGNAERYSAFSNYVVFNDRWGTSRGYIWRESVELFQEFSPMRKLFGYGPDTFGILTTNEIKESMVNTTGMIFDTAHNEYLHFLLTIGLTGTVAYMIFLGNVVWKCVARRNMDKYIMACGIAVLCYAAQATVNLNLPIATPMMWFMASAGMAAYLNVKENN